MPPLLLVSPEPCAGKTAIAAGLARKLREAGKSFSLTRLDGGASAGADAQLFATFPGVLTQGADVALIEAAAGDFAAALAQAPDARVIAVAAGAADAGAVRQFCAPAAERLAGVILNRVPARRLEAARAAYAAAGQPLLALVPEDRVLAAPALGAVAAALSAEASFLAGNELTPLDRPLIASISADPGQGYFDRYGATAVIVRSDKPDLQLAALNAGTRCLIVTGGLPILSYVLDRAGEDSIPLLRTDLDTIRTVEAIEALFATVPFAGGEARLRRASELLDGLDVAPLLA